MIDAAPSARDAGRMARRRPRALARPAAVAFLALVAIAAGACTAGSPAGATSSGLPSAPPEGSAAPTPILTPIPVLSPGNPTPVTGTGEVPGSVIDAAKADAAERAGVDVADVTLVSADAIDWPSGALGCPRMGFLYIDVITPGFRVVVRAGDRDYDYRAARDGAIRWCENPPPTI
jgi:hypothetical protein